jgi:hypothetical protein
MRVCWNDEELREGFRLSQLESIRNVRHTSTNTLVQQ